MSDCTSVDIVHSNEPKNKSCQFDIKCAKNHTALTTDYEKQTLDSIIINNSYEICEKCFMNMIIENYE